MGSQKDFLTWRGDVDGVSYILPFGPTYVLMEALSDANTIDEVQESIRRFWLVIETGIRDQSIQDTLSYHWLVRKVPWYARVRLL